MITAITNAIIYTGEEKIEGKTLLIEHGKIRAVVNSSEIAAGSKILDFSDYYIAPGLLDLQIYGSGGFLFAGSPTVGALHHMETLLLKQGCTGFFATVGTNTSEIVEQAIDSAKSYRKNSIGNFLGLHLEGPFLNTVRRGAHPANLIRKATLAEVKGWVERADGEIKMITIAPELQDEEVINYLNSQNIVISAGHSDANFEEGMQFFENKAFAATHIFNAMPQLHHRDPGLVAAIFKQKPYASIVADGIHVKFPMVELAKREMGNKLFYITDAVTETKEGVYQHILKDDHYVMPDGTLSGSCLSMLKAVKNGIKHAGISVEESLRMASTYPATLINRQNDLGFIKPDAIANLIVFDKDLNLKSTILSGLIH
ncbi:MAG: N-acetylglucosamine-6-phosphate deacetylase [Flavobacterium sp.]|nr:N-acetylglucosamine-6-phosphate deacetylase [Pedobacter sp.]